MSKYIRYPSITWQPPVETVGDLPVDALPGDARVVIGTDTIYVYGNDNLWHAIGGGGGGGITELTGDGTAGPGSGSQALTLATVNGAPGSFGSASSTLSLTVNGKGLVTSASASSIAIAQSQVANLITDLAGKQPTGNYITGLTGDVTATGPGSVAATIAANAVTNSKLAQMPTLTIKGNNTGGASDPLDLTSAQTTAILDNFVGDTTSLAGTKGLVSAPPAGSTLIGRVLTAANTFSANFPEETSAEAVTAVTVWNAQSASAANQWIGLCWAPEIRTFAAVASNGTDRVMTSQDGVTWAPQTAASAVTWTAVAWSNTLLRYVAVAFDGTTATNTMYSDDGVTWLNGTSPQANQWYSIAWSPALKLFCATSLNGANRVMTSSDGITWSPQTSPIDQWYGVCWADHLNLFAAISTTGSVMTSPDGVTWSLQTGGIGTGHDITYSRELGLLCAVGLTGTRSMTSPDGVNWTLHGSTPAASWRRVVWAKDLGLFVAVASGGQIMTSPNGSTWTLRTASAANQWYGLAYAEDLKIVASTSITGTDRVMLSTYIKGYNTSGLTGPAGPAGATGPTGPVGPASATGELVTASVVQTAQQTTTSAAFVDIPGLSTTITSTRDCRIFAQLDAILACTSVTAVAEVRLVIDAQNGTTHSINLPNTVDTKDLSTNFLSTSLVAGTYTVKAQYRETSGLGTLALNTGVIFVQAQQGAGPYSVNQASEVREDWVAGAAAGNTGWTAAQTGTGAASAIVSTNVEANRPGVVQMSTGTTATGRASLALGSLSTFFGGGINVTEMSVRVPTLSTALQEYTLRLGYGDLVTGADHADGVYFEYDRTQSVNWRCKTANNSARTTADSGVLVAAGAWIQLRFVVNAAGTSVQFYINGTLVATNVTNIPITSARVCSPTLIINKTVGTTASTVLFDYYNTQTVFTTPR